MFAVDGTEDRWQSEGEENVETVYLFSLDLTTGNLHCSGASGKLRKNSTLIFKAVFNQSPSGFAALPT